MSHPYKITDQLVDDTLTTALEGGITYWAIAADPVNPPADATSKMFPGEPAFASELLTMGVDIVITLDPELDDQTYVLTLAKMKAGLRKYAEMRKVTMAHFEDDPMDASDADCVVQLALFGEIVYG